MKPSYLYGSILMNNTFPGNQLFFVQHQQKFDGEVPK